MGVCRRRLLFSSGGKSPGEDSSLCVMMGSDFRVQIAVAQFYGILNIFQMKNLEKYGMLLI